MLYRVLQKLPPKLRIVLVLRRVEGLTVPDMAEQMGTSEASIKRWLRKAEAALHDGIYGERKVP
jgi:RNA polymerase sigma factor (sigma-70 family)